MYYSNYVNVVTRTPSGREVSTMRRAGFTLIEILIVIVIIAILAAIIFPQMFGAAREAREASLKAHLQTMRNAIAHFEKECGCFPNQLNDIMATVAPKVGANGDKIKPSKFKGPYMKTELGGLPYNSITGDNVAGQDWQYDPGTGEVHAPSGEAMDGTNYSDW